MTRLLCNGIALDLYESTKLKFKKKNTLFAFDDLSAERTTQFKIPCTANNDRAFALARIPAYAGEAMRVKYAAQLQYGAVAMDGFLYIGEFDGKDYSVIFVGGLAYDLKAWNNERWGDLLLQTNYSTYSETYDANDPDTPMIARVKYHFDNESGQGIGSRYMGSIHIEQLFTALTSQGLFKITGLVGSNMRLIRNDVYGYDGVLEKLQNVQSHAGYLELASRQQILGIKTVNFYGNTAEFFYLKGNEQFVAITFPADTPANLCICGYRGYVTGYPFTDEVVFVGPRSFYFDANNNPVYTGEPLAGQTVVVGRDFLLMDASGAHAEYVSQQQYVRFNFDTAGMGNVPTYDLAVRIASEVSDSNPLPLNSHSMLMDLSLGKLIQIYAACTGTLVCVRNDGSVEFVQGFGNVQIEPRLMARKNVKRTFGDWAQNNIVKFKDSNAVGDWEKLTNVYTINNVNLENEKTVLTLECIEGGQYPEQTPPFTYDHPVQPIPDNAVMYIRDTKQDYYGYYIPADTIALADTEAYLQRVTLPKNNPLQGLCDKSTLHKIKAHMTYAQFNKIDGDTTLLADGTLYTWVEASWGEETADLTLQKIV